MPKTLSSPIAHDGHAGEIRPTNIPVKLAPILPFTWRFTTNTIIARTMPVKTDIMIKRTSEEVAIMEIVPKSNEKKRENEKSEKRIL